MIFKNGGRFSATAHLHQEGYIHSLELEPKPHPREILSDNRRPHVAGRAY